MPIYEYRCPDCGDEFERLQSFKEPPVTACPSCGEGRVKKLISKTSFALKGGGWYKDHYGLKSGGGGSKGGSGDGAKASGGADSGGGAKSSGTASAAAAPAKSAGASASGDS